MLQLSSKPPFVFFGGGGVASKSVKAVDSLFELLNLFMSPISVTTPTTFNEPAEQTANLRKDACESVLKSIHTHTPWYITMTAEKHHHKDRWSRAAKRLNKYLSCFLLPLQLVSVWQEFTHNEVNPDYLNCAQTDQSYPSDSRKTPNKKNQ